MTARRKVTMRKSALGDPGGAARLPPELLDDFGKLMAYATEKKSFSGGDHMVATWASGGEKKTMQGDVPHAFEVTFDVTFK